MKMRIGIGYDIHRLEENRRLILGGVEIPYEKGLAGHSDADVLIHAIIDALLGAVTAGDIGTYFPPEDNQYKDVDSSILLKQIATLVIRAGYKINNIDTNIITEQPKLKDYMAFIRVRLAEILSIETNQISVKAKTNEGLGYIGEGRAIAAQAIVLLVEHELDSI